MCSSCSAPAGARARSTSSPPRCCGPAAPGPTLLVSPLLGLMRNQIEAAERGGVRAVTINSDNQGRLGRGRRRARREQGRRAARLPRAVRQPGVPRERAPAGRAAHRPARDRRGALHQRLGPRLPARLPPPRPRPRPPPPRRPRARHHRHRERPGRRRRAGPARRGAAHPPRARSTARASPSTRSRSARSPTGSPGSRRCCRRCPAPGSSTRSPSPTRTGSPSGCAPRASTPAPTPARPTPRRSSAIEDDLSAQPDQGRRRHLRARHGLRQARPRVRRALPVARLADRLLPAGRPGRARHRPGRGHPARRPRGRRHPGLVHPHRVPRPRAGRGGGRAARRRGPTGCRSTRSRTR